MAKFWADDWRIFSLEERSSGLTLPLAKVVPRQLGVLGANWDAGASSSFANSLSVNFYNPVSLPRDPDKRESYRYRQVPPGSEDSEEATSCLGLVEFSWVN